MDINADLTWVHEELYTLLSQLRIDNPSLTYTYRKSNHAGRLEDGYWFYGNEHYLAISFWSGMDWKNRTPNIVFIILRNGECYLEVNVSDSPAKRVFVDSFMVDPLKLEVNGRKYVKHYDRPDIGAVGLFRQFINEDKVLIDQILREYVPHYRESEAEDMFWFISKEEFKKRQDKVNLYREKKQQLDNQSEDLFWNEKKPSRLKRVFIEKYGLIENVTIDLEANTEWVFITGPNGTGKTNFLRALGAALGNKILNKKDIKGRALNDFWVEVDLEFKGKIETFSRRGNELIPEAEKPLVQGLAMYGPYRLDVIDESITTREFKRKLWKRESFKSLFVDGEKLLNLDKQLSIWRIEKPNKFNKLEYYIRSVLTDVVPDLVNIEFGRDTDEGTRNIYVFQRDESIQEMEWEDMSSGTKSVFALLGDILVRLYNHQRSILDPSEFTGVVIIDEVDLHLHPQAQKDLVQNLSKTFPNVQFIVSTHSPIPLLGAPRRSVFLKVERIEEVIVVNKIDLDISNLLPNSILSSPIFGFDDLFPQTHDRNKKIKTEDFYSDVVSNNEKRAFLKSVADNLKNS